MRDAAYAPLDNAAVTIRVTAPDKQSLELPAEASDRQAGVYEATYVPRQPGRVSGRSHGHRARRQRGRPVAGRLDLRPGGRGVPPVAGQPRAARPTRRADRRRSSCTSNRLDQFVADLPNRRAEITEPYVNPLWHQPWIFLLAIACLVGEWGLRRWSGLP